MHNQGEKLGNTPIYFNNKIIAEKRIIKLAIRL